MMRNNNFFKRLKACINFLFFGNAGIRLMTCGKCGSINIVPVAETEKYEEISDEMEQHGVKIIWREVDVCNKCGAAVVERQYWVWDKEK